MGKAKRWVAFFMLIGLVLTGCSTGLEDFSKDVKPSDLARAKETAEGETEETQIDQEMAETVAFEPAGKEEQ